MRYKLEPWKMAVVGLVLAVGIGLITVGVLKTTRWAPSENIIVTAQPGKSHAAIVIEPGVLQAYKGSPKITAAAESGEVSWVLGREEDANAWLQGMSVARIAGFDEADQTKFTVTESDASGETEPPARAVNADVWSESWTDTGTVTVEPPSPTGRWVLVAMTNGAEPGPVSVNVSWPADTSVPEAAPMVVLGGTLVALAGIGAAYFVWSGNRAAALGAIRRGGAHSRHREDHL